MRGDRLIEGGGIEDGRARAMSLSSRGGRLPRVNPRTTHSPGSFMAALAPYTRAPPPDPRVLLQRLQNRGETKTTTTQHTSRLVRFGLTDKPTHTWWPPPSPQDAGDANDRQYDGIVVLAGGLTASGGVPEWVKGRLEAAADLHSRSPGSVILVTGGGTPHKPPILHDRSGHVIHESTVCADYLVSELGVSPNSVLKETSSYDTIGNAYFSLTIHAAPLGWSEVCTVTSAFHMPRARACFDWIYGACASAPRVAYLPVADEGMTEAALEARRRREEESAAALRRSAEEVGADLAAISGWLHSTHRCYAVNRQHEWGEPTEATKEELETY